VREEQTMKRTITNNRSRPARYVSVPRLRSKPVAGTASSQNRRPVGDVRSDLRFVRTGGARPQTTAISKRKTQ
jgi:hypothetical protein